MTPFGVSHCITFQGCACLNVSHLKLLKTIHNSFAYCKWANRNHWCPFRWFFGNILEIFLEKIFKKISYNLKKILCIILLRFVLKICQKYVIFKVFQIHLQVFLSLKFSDYKSIYTTFEGPNVDEIISYFGHL